MNGSPDPVAGKPLLQPERPTWVRWRIVALLMAFSFASWFLRVSMPVAYDERIRDQFSDLSVVGASTAGLMSAPLGQGPLAAAAGLYPGRTRYTLSEEAIGYVYSGFLLVYMLCMTPGGRLIDRFGPRRALLLMGFGLGAFAVLTGLTGLAVPVWGALAGPVGYSVATGVLMLALLLVVRCLMGAFAAPMYPAGGSVIARWMPFRQRSGANGLVQGFACLGIASTFFLFGALIDRVGWPLAFLISGAGTAVLAWLWTVYATDRPGQHRGVNPAEQRLIRQDAQSQAVPGPEGQAEEGGDGRWLDLLRNRSLVLLTLSYAAVGYFEYLFFFWMGHYFKEKLALDDSSRRLYATAPPLAMMVGMWLGGWISDRLVRSFGYRWGRVSVPVAGMLAGAGLLYLGVRSQDATWIVTWFSLALGAVGAVEGPIWATAIDLGGRRGGTSGAICNTGGNAGGMIAPIVTPLVGTRLGWPWAITLGSLVCLAGVCLWFWIDPRERVEARETE